MNAETKVRNAVRERLYSRFFEGRNVPLALILDDGVLSYSDSREASDDELRRAIVHERTLLQHRASAWEAALGRLENGAELEDVIILTGPTIVLCELLLECRDNGMAL